MMMPGTPVATHSTRAARHSGLPVKADTPKGALPAAGVQEKEDLEDQGLRATGDLGDFDDRKLIFGTRGAPPQVRKVEHAVERYFEVEKILWENMEDVGKMLLRNRLFMDRMCDVGIISQEDAIANGFTGPCLRSTGVEYDVRKAAPYLFYTFVIT